MRLRIIPSVVYLACIGLSSLFVARSADAHFVYLAAEEYGVNFFLQALDTNEDGSGFVGTQLDAFSFFPEARDLDYTASIQAGEQLASGSFSFESSTNLAGDIFTYTITSEGTAYVTRSLDDAFGAFAAVNLTHLLLEFYVTEEVLYQGGFLLADVSADRFTPSPEGANFFGSGSILAPGTYSFVGGRPWNTGELASTGYLFADPGQTLGSSFFYSNTARFTAVPTPASALLFATGLSLMIAARLRRRRDLAG